MNKLKSAETLAEENYPYLENDLYSPDDADYQEMIWVINEKRLAFIEGYKAASQLKGDAVEVYEANIDEIAGIMYANSTDESDDGKWIEGKDYHKVAALILKKTSIPSSAPDIDHENYTTEQLYQIFLKDNEASGNKSNHQ